MSIKSKSNQRVANNNYRENFDQIIWNSIEKAISCKDSTKSGTLQLNKVGKFSVLKVKA